MGAYQIAPLVKAKWLFTGPKSIALELHRVFGKFYYLVLGYLYAVYLKQLADNKVTYLIA